MFLVDLTFIIVIGIGEYKMHCPYQHLIGDKWQDASNVVYRMFGIRPRKS